jgi:ketosteroid isomerase-like protein
VASENVEIARRAYTAYNTGGIDAIVEFLDPEIEWHMWERFARGSRVYRGHAGVREALAVFEENFDDFAAEPHEFIEVGDRVIVPVRLHGKAKGTGEEVGFELVQVWTGRDGLGARLDVYESKEDALRETESAEEASSPDNSSS